MPASIRVASKRGTSSRKRCTFSSGVEAHDALDAGAIVPAPVEDQDLAGSRELRDIALDEDLRFLAVARRRQRHHAEDPRDPIRSVMRRIIPPFPAASRPSKMTTILWPVAFTQVWR